MELIAPRQPKPSKIRHAKRPAKRNSCRPWLEPLECRLAPAIGTFVEDFSSDTDPAVGGFDGPADGALNWKQF